MYFLGNKAHSFWRAVIYGIIKERNRCVLRNGIGQSVDVEVGSSSLLGWMHVVTVWFGLFFLFVCFLKQFHAT